MAWESGRNTGRAQRPTLALGLLTATAAAVVLAGCGGSSTTNSAASASTSGSASSASGASSSPKIATIGTSANPIVLAAQSSTSVPGYKITFSEAIGGTAAGAITAHGSGAYDVATRSGSFAFDFGGSSAISSVFGNAPLQLVLDGTSIYMHLPASLAGRLPGGKPWLKIDLATAGASIGLGSALSNPAQMNPGQFLDYLRATSGSVTKVGTARIGGLATTEYRAVEDLRKYASILPAAQRAAAQQGIASLEKITGVTTIPIAVWVDNQHLVRQFQLSLAEKTPATGSKPIDIAITADIPEYGPQTGTSPPPSSQVYDISSQVAGLLGSAASGGASALGGASTSSGSGASA
jgi:hypothetical protein